MKFSTLVTLIAGLLGLALLGRTSGFAAETNRTLTAHARTAKAAPPAPAVVEPAPLPLSTFVVPRQVTEGRDPFFPNSTRVYGSDSASVTNKGPTVVADLTLKGISGTPEQPLAIINTTTFTTGETNEVLIKNGRVKIMCVEINMTAGTVLVQIGAERRELRLVTDK
jgi:hypothetical protein